VSALLQKDRAGRASPAAGRDELVLTGRLLPAGDRHLSLDLGIETVAVVPAWDGPAPKPGSWVSLRGIWRDGRLRATAVTASHEPAIPLSRWSTLTIAERGYLLEPKRRKAIVDRARAIGWLRRTLNKEGFIEVQTPIMHRNAEACHVAQFLAEGPSGRKGFLRTDPEEYLKRYLTIGIDAVYEVAANLRDETDDATHLCEFTSIECYKRFWTFADALDLSVALIAGVLELFNGSPQARYGGARLNFSPPLARRRFDDLVADHAHLDPTQYPGPMLMNEIRRRGLWNGTATSLDQFRRTWLEWLFDQFVLPRIDTPTAVVEFPVELGLSARESEPGSGVALRGEIYLPGGLELAHIYENIVDPAELAQRYDERLAHRLAAGMLAVRRDLDLQQSADAGMPPMSGLAIGIDRILMVASGDAEAGRGCLFARECHQGGNP
jgi:lysyl-tRNA synthetase, class II